jgi:hypothetical protein
MKKEIFALGVGESINNYSESITHIFDKHSTITIHNGLLKLYEKFKKLPTYYTWGDPFGALNTLRFLNQSGKVSTKILVPSTMSTTYEDFRKYHGTSRISQGNNWNEYIELIQSLFQKGFEVYVVPTTTTKIKNPSPNERFSEEKITMGTVEYTGDASENRNAVETKLTSLIFPLSHYLGYKKVYVLGFDTIGGRFYEKIEGVPSDPWPKNQLPYLIENMDMWVKWKQYHNMDLISVVEDKFTINNRALEYKDINTIYGTSMKKWSEYYKECKDNYKKESNADIIDLTMTINDIKSQPIFNFDKRYLDTISLLKNKMEKELENSSNYEFKSIAMGIKDIFKYEDELKIIVEDYLIPELEEKVFGCHVTCDNIKMYKTPETNANEASSWLWHLDNNPIEQVKVMIYINDVNKESGAFRYLGQSDKSGIKVLPSRRDYTHWFEGDISKENFEALDTKWNGTRLSNQLINDWINNKGCQIVDVEGPAGTALLFDNNIIHKGTIPTKGYRLAMTLQFKPIHYKPKNAFTKEYVGNGWNHVTFHKDPEIYKPVKY